MSTDVDKITKLEQQVAQLIKQNQELNQRVQFQEEKIVADEVRPHRLRQQLIEEDKNESSSMEQV